jgi:hypothetical protein
VKHRWDKVVNPREHGLLGDTELMMDVGQRARNEEPIPERCFGDVGAAQDTSDIEFREVLAGAGFD